MSIFQKIKSYLTSDTTNSNYDTFIETRSMTPNTINGLRSEFSNQVTPSFSITSSFLLSERLPNFFSVTGTFSRPNFIFQSTIDQENSLQNRLSMQFSNIILRVQSLYSKTSGSFSQIEANSSFLGGNLGIKVICPAFQEINPIYVVNYLKKIKGTFFGVETIITSEKRKNHEIGVGLAVKKAFLDSEVSLSVQQLTAMNICYVKRMNKWFKMGMDLNYSLISREMISNTFFNIHTKRTVVKSQVDSTGKFCSSVEDRITDNLVFCLSVESDLLKGSTALGVGFNLEN